MNKQQGLIFDIDGTLADTLPLCIYSFKTAISRLAGIVPDENDVMDYFYNSTKKKVVEKFIKGGWDKYLEEYLKIYRENFFMCPGLFDGLMDVFEYLKSKDIKMAIVSSKGEEASEITLDDFGIKDYFEYIEHGNYSGSIKPEGILKIIKKWQIPKENIFYVGDTVIDILDCQSLGIKCISAAWSPKASTELLEQQKPYLLFKKVSDFKQWLTQNL